MKNLKTALLALQIFIIVFLFITIIKLGFKIAGAAVIFYFLIKAEAYLSARVAAQNQATDSTHTQ